MKHDDKRPWRKWYGTARWQQMRVHQLSSEPLCRFCLDAERVTEAEVVDHIKRHSGSPELFWDVENLQSLCAQCHDRTKREMERGKSVVRYGADGWPL